MLHIWDAVEADFFRDYGIDLVEQLDHMSWRRFVTLLNNLSPYGAVAMQIRARNEGKNKERDEKDEEKAADAFFSSIMSL